MPDFEHDLEKMLAAVCLGESAEVNLPDIAARYATACTQVNERLRRCVELLKKGLRDEALQHAKTAPAVLEQFASLDFAEREAWAQFVRNRGLTVPPPLQTPLAIELNTAFAEAETLKDSVKRHRLLALGRAPLERRLAVLWHLAKLDPLNPIWVKDLQIFEAARHREIEQDLVQAHQAGQLPRLQQLLKELAAPSWTQPPPPALIQRGRALRDQHLARSAQSRIVPLEQQLTAATNAGNKAEALTLAEEAQTLRSACGLSGTHPVIQRLDLALAWVDKQNQRDARIREWQGECAKLRQIASTAVNAETVERQEQRVLGYGMGLPPELEQVVRDKIDELERRRKRVQLAWFGAAFLVVLIFVLGMIVWIRLRGNRPHVEEAPVAADKDKQKNEQMIAELPAKLDPKAVLVKNCFECHGNEENGGLGDILDRERLIDTESKKPPGFKHLVPGKPEESAIWWRVEQDTMPPRKMPRLSQPEKDAIREWILRDAPSLK